MLKLIHVSISLTMTVTIAVTTIQCRFTTATPLSASPGATACVLTFIQHIDIPFVVIVKLTDRFLCCEGIAHFIRAREYVCACVLVGERNANDRFYLQGFDS